MDELHKMFMTSSILSQFKKLNKNSITEAQNSAENFGSNDTYKTEEI